MDYATKVEELLKMPQELCKMCGLCCKLATFKGGMSYPEIQQIANDFSQPSQADGAKDFLTIFQLIPHEKARKVAPGFFDEIQKRFEGKKEDMDFFECRFMKDGSLCMIHEDRPLLCRMYPIPHERTIYHICCGFKQRGEKNWKEIKQIMIDLQEKCMALEEEKQIIQEETEEAISEASKILAETEAEFNLED